MISDWIAVYQCWRHGHRRGRFLRLDKTAIGEAVKVYGCPRCGRETRYKIKQTMPPNVGTSGEEA